MTMLVLDYEVDEAGTAAIQIGNPGRKRFKSNRGQPYMDKVTTAKHSTLLFRAAKMLEEDQVAWESGTACVVLPSEPDDKVWHFDEQRGLEPGNCKACILGVIAMACGLYPESWDHFNLGYGKTNPYAGLFENVVDSLVSVDIDAVDGGDIYMMNDRWAMKDGKENTIKYLRKHARLLKKDGR